MNNLGLTDVGEIAKKIAMLPKENGSTSRLVVITQGSDPVIAVQHGKILKFPVESLAKEAIVDTNGAEDAFVGCIQLSGCTMPDICDFKVGQEMWDFLPRVLPHSIKLMQVGVVARKQASAM